MNEPCQKFKLLCLPLLELTEVIKHMKLSERIKLALTSKRMKEIVSSFKLPFAEYTLSFKEEFLYIFLKDENFYIFCGDRPSYPDRDFINREDVKQWINLKRTPKKTMIAVLRNLQSISKRVSYIFLLDIENIKLVNLSQLLSIPVLSTKNKLIKIEKEELSVEKVDLDEIMETAEQNTSIEVQRFMPEDYDHVNAFKFQNVNYHYAGWVRIEHLLTLENCGDVNLRNTRLTHENINTLIKHWIQSDCDMFRNLSINNYSSDDLHKTRIFDDVPLVREFKMDDGHYLVAACISKTKRRQTALCVQKTGETLRFKAYSQETFPFQFLPFQLTRLPLLVITNVINCMKPPERIKLAVLSKRMNTYVSYCKPPVVKYTLRFHGDFSYISSIDDDFYIFCGTRPFYSRDKCIKREDMKLWIKMKGSYIENMISVIRNLQTISKCELYTLLLDLENLKITNVRKVLSLPEMSNNMKCITFESGSQPTGEFENNFKRIMDLADDKVSIIYSERWPENISHEKALKFHSIYYHYANWVRIEHLLTLENRGDVNLRHTQLTHRDINTLIKHWIQSDCDMFRNLTINDVIANALNWIRSLRDVIVLKAVGMDADYYLIKACSSKTERKQTILCFYYLNGLLCFDTYTPETCPPVFLELASTLDTIIRREGMEKELRTVDSLISNGNNTAMDITMRRELTIQIQEMNELIASNNVLMLDGFYTFVFPGGQ